MNNLQFNQTKQTTAAKGEVWLNVNGMAVTIGEFGDYQTASDFLYSEFQNYRTISNRPFEDLAFNLDISADYLFDILLEGADEQEIMDLLIYAYNGQEG